jgi:hypothetical protein
MKKYNEIRRKEFEKSRWKLDEPMHLDKDTKSWGERRNYVKNKQMLEERGFSDSEIWNLDETIAEFILPRLIYYRDNLTGTPSSYTQKFKESGEITEEDSKKADEAWERDLDKMIVAFQLIYGNDGTDSDWEERDKVIEEGLILFALNLRAIWD